VHTAAKVTDFMAARGIKLIQHPPYSPDLAPADYFLFPRIKKELAGLTMTQDTFKKLWEGPSRVSRRRTSPKHSGDGISATKSAFRSAADTLRTARNTNCSNYHRFLLISVVRVVSILTPYSRDGHPPFMTVEIEISCTVYYSS
jgi:hypothetical protein